MMQVHLLMKDTGQHPGETKSSQFGADHAVQRKFKSPPKGSQSFRSRIISVRVIRYFISRGRNTR
jgi:hypothetical protein